MGNTNFGKYDESKLEKKYKDALEDASFKKLVNSVDLPDEIKMRHTTGFEESVSELNNCKNCKGLMHCKNKINGFVYYPSVHGNLIKFDYVACKYKKKVIKEEEETCDFYGITDALKKATMKDITVDDAKRVPIIKWLKNFYDTYQSNPNQKGLYLHGSFGAGKTYMIVGMLNDLSKKNVDVLAVYYPELLRSLKESFETDFKDRINRIKKSEILFLDDIGAESVTPWARDEILGTILQYRMEESLPTFFTSNLSIDELEAHLSTTKTGVEKVKARRIIERIKQLSDDLELISKNRRV